MSDLFSPTLTVAELLAAKIDEVDAMCLRCGRTWRAPISFLPATTSLEKIAELMSCPTCGGRKIDVGPAAEVKGSAVN